MGLSLGTSKENIQSRMLSLKIERILIKEEKEKLYKLLEEMNHPVNRIKIPDYLNTEITKSIETPEDIQKQEEEKLAELKKLQEEEEERKRKEQLRQIEKMEKERQNILKIEKLKAEEIKQSMINNPNAVGHPETDDLEGELEIDENDNELKGIRVADIIKGNKEKDKDNEDNENIGKDDNLLEAESQGIEFSNKYKNASKSFLINKEGKLEVVEKKQEEVKEDEKEDEKE